MECQQCGFVLDPLDNGDCPRCRKISLREQQQRLQALTMPRPQTNEAAQKARSRRDRAAEHVTILAQLSLWGGLVVGILMMIVAFIAALGRQSEIAPATGMVFGSGLVMMFGGYFWFAIFNWAAELLRCLARQEDNNNA